MELLRQVTNVQFLYPAAAVILVLICAGLVFVFGFHSAEQPQFDKLPIIVDDKKSSSKKKKPKEKKTSPNREAKSEPKKSPVKEKKEEKTKEPKPEKKVAEPKVKKEAEAKKGKKNKNDIQKPEDFDDGLWEEVPKKSDKKKTKSEEKKESPVKKAESPVKKVESPSKKSKKSKEADVEAAMVVDEVPTVGEETLKVEVVRTGPAVDEEAARLLQAQVEQFQKALKAVELRDQGIVEDEESPGEELPEVKDLRSEKKKENKEKQVKKKEAAAKNAIKVEEVPENDVSDSVEKESESKNGPVFDELGDTWTDAKVPKKGKKKARKD